MPAARPSSGYGILSWFVPPTLAGEVAREAAAERDAALAAAGEKVPRRSRLPPPWLAVYFTLALCLLARLPYQDALRSLAGDGAAGLAVPATTALAAARRRLGGRPLELLFQRVAGVLLPSRDPWATVGGPLVAAWDGTTLKVPATPENIAALGRPRHGSGRKAPPGGKGGKAPPGEGRYPQMRVVALIARGARALLGAATGPLADGEQKPAATLAGCLGPGMLLLADRGFWPVALWRSGGNSSQRSPAQQAPQGQAPDVAEQLNFDRGLLLARSALALGLVSVAAVGAGWLLAGRVLRPLSTITTTAQRISASSLHERLALDGPDDELKELGDTLDALLTRLEDSFDAQRHFAANASHELRTPLTRERTLLQVTLSDPASTLDTWQAVSRELLASNSEQERLIEGMLPWPPAKRASASASQLT